MAFIVIVGASKIPIDKEQRARLLVEDIVNDMSSADIVISGGATGVDSIAIECAIQAGTSYKVYKPLFQSWKWFKKRNIAMAEISQMLYYLPIKDVDERCYHCNMNGHRKSGACWTAMYARGIGKSIHQIVI